MITEVEVEDVGTVRVPNMWQQVRIRGQGGGWRPIVAEERQPDTGGDAVRQTVLSIIPGPEPTQYKSGKSQV
jgi:hypothetical protein